MSEGKGGEGGAAEEKTSNRSDSHKKNVSTPIRKKRGGC